MFADPANACELVLLEELDGRAEEEAPLRLPACRHLGDRLDQAASELSDLLERALHRGAGDTPTAVSLVDEDARDPPIGTWRKSFMYSRLCLMFESSSGPPY